MSGWIKLNRDIRHNWLWSQKPFSKAQAWVDLLLSANHKDSKVYIKGQLIELKCGDSCRSIVSLSSDWGWSKDKVRRFLTLLESDGMLRHQTSHLTSIISICNYNKYQNDDTAGETPKKTPNGKQTGQCRDTDKNVKNVKNNNMVGFDDFWPEYPKKVGKIEAQKAWAKIKPVNGTLTAIMEGLEKWKQSDQWLKDGGAFIPNPATWLNGERWNDELPKQSGNEDSELMQRFRNAL